MSVALFDNSHPREKPCGGLVENRVVEEFNVPEELLENEVKWFVAERFGLRTRLPMKPSAFLVSRKDFDYYLLEEALKNRSVVLFEERAERIRRDKNWIVETNKGRSVRVKSLIGADGCPSLVRAKVLHPIPAEFLTTTVGRNFLSTSKYIEEAFLKNTVEAYYSKKYVQRSGFAWIFPKKNSINVGIGGSESGKKLAQSLERFISSHPAGQRLRNLKGEFYTHLIPTIRREDFYDLPCSGRDWALIGDAAGHVNAINGAGIYYSMRGGILCGSAILRGDLRLFDEYWRDEYGDELCFGARIFSKYYSKLGFFPWLQFLVGNSPFRSLFLLGTA